MTNIERTERLIALLREHAEDAPLREQLLDQLFAHRRLTWQPLRPPPPMPPLLRPARRISTSPQPVRSLGETLQTYSLAPAVFEPRPVPGRPAARAG